MHLAVETAPDTKFKNIEISATKAFIQNRMRSHRGFFFDDYTKKQEGIK